MNVFVEIKYVPLVRKWSFITRLDYNRRAFVATTSRVARAPASWSGRQAYERLDARIASDRPLKSSRRERVLVRIQQNSID